MSNQTFSYNESASFSVEAIPPSVSQHEAQYTSSGQANSSATVSNIASDLLLLNASQGSSSPAQSNRYAKTSSALSNHQARSVSHNSQYLNASYGAQFSNASHGAQFSSASSNLNASSQEATALSVIESAILRSNIPIDINETEELTVNFNGSQERGIWANRSEVINWKGIIPISEYLINEDSNPEVITKRTEQSLVYVQELAIRYLRPPTPPAPGEIVITQEMNTLIPPAPPLVIRQQPDRPCTPEPLVIREAPPEPPAAVGRKVITISGKRIPPPPRKVVIERLAPLPVKPQSVLVERWLPYSQVKRRVIFQRSNERDAVVVKPHNVIVQWEAPQVQIKKEFKYLGVIRANPVEYVQRYGSTLKVARDLPDYVHEIKTPEDLVLAADYHYNSVYELEGDVQAMKLVDLDREGLSEYRSLLTKLGISYVGAEGVAAAAVQLQSSGSASFQAASSTVSGNAVQSNKFSSRSASFKQEKSAGSQLGSSLSVSNNIVNDIFTQIDLDHNGSLSIDEANALLLSLNSRLGRSYGENERKDFFRVLDINKDNRIDLQEFKRAFERLL